MSNIKRMKDKDGNYIYPVTHASAVFDDDNISLKDKLDNLDGTGIVDTSNFYTKDEVDDEILRIESELNSVKLNVSDGKDLIAAAITDKGVETSGDDTFSTMASNISKIEFGTSNNNADPYKENRSLIWEDDFNGSTLDNSVWNYETGYIRNNEIQNYTNSDKNAYIENGKLVLKAIREQSYGYKKDVGMTAFDWSSASINTNNKCEFLYGRIEAKIKIDVVAGAFPAFWAMPADYEYVCSEDNNRGNYGTPWPFCGEIDIMEHYPGTDTTITGGLIYSTSLEDSNTKEAGRSRSQTINFDEYHIYGMEWTEEKIELYVDDVIFSSIDISDKTTYSMFHKPYYIILNYAVGASGGTPDASTQEMLMYVDWVRVYAPQQNITLNTDELSLNIGDEYYLNADFSSYSGVERTIIWNSGDNEIATVHGGKVRAIGEGSTIISATPVYGETKSCSIIVGDSNGDDDTTWLYSSDTDGLLSEQSFVSLNAAANFTETIVDGVLVLNSPIMNDSVNGIYEITPATHPTGELTAKYKCIEVPTNDIGQGFRLQLSNGQTGCQLFHYQDTNTEEYVIGVIIGEGTPVKVASLTLNRVYTSTIRLLEDSFEVYIDGEKVYTSNNLSSYYCTKNRIMNTTPGGNWGDSAITHVYNINYSFDITE